MSFVHLIIQTMCLATPTLVQVAVAILQTGIVLSNESFLCVEVPMPPSCMVKIDESFSSFDSIVPWLDRAGSAVDRSGNLLAHADRASLRI